MRRHGVTLLTSIDSIFYHWSAVEKKTFLTPRHFTIIPLNPLIATLKPQSNGPSHSNTVIGTLAID